MQKEFSAVVLGLVLALSMGQVAAQGVLAASFASSGGGLQPTIEASRWLFGLDPVSRWAAESGWGGPQRQALPGFWPEPEVTVGAGVSYALTPELRLQAGYLHALDRQGLKPRGLSLGLGLSF